MMKCKMENVKCKMKERLRRAFHNFTLYTLHFTFATALAAAAGCASETVKVVEGTDLSVGFTIPGMEGEANFTVFNYLSGFKTTTAESNRVKLKYTCSETNDYFGVITTRIHKGVEAEIEPVVDEPEEEEAETTKGTEAK